LGWGWPAIWIDGDAEVGGWLIFVAGAVERLLQFDPLPEEKRRLSCPSLARGFREID
jgi:hypothetical protein